ncbi:hypothetical protein N431DRAFT_457019 [Stipitochalara longipes BDJ]|nr:hypothetical protein N431DRAFT_457019 [Stipitochalara longipes BDJ]
MSDHSNNQDMIMEVDPLQDHVPPSYYVGEQPRELRGIDPAVFDSVVQYNHPLAMSNGDSRLPEYHTSGLSNMDYSYNSMQVVNHQSLTTVNSISGYYGAIAMTSQVHEHQSIDLATHSFSTPSPSTNNFHNGNMVYHNENMVYNSMPTYHHPAFNHGNTYALPSHNNEPASSVSHDVEYLDLSSIGNRNYNPADNDDDHDVAVHDDTYITACHPFHHDGFTGSSSMNIDLDSVGGKRNVSLKFSDSGSELHSPQALSAAPPSTAQPNISQASQTQVDDSVRQICQKIQEEFRRTMRNGNAWAKRTIDQFYRDGRNYHFMVDYINLRFAQYLPALQKFVQNEANKLWDECSKSSLFSDRQIQYAKKIAEAKFGKVLAESQQGFSQGLKVWAGSRFIGLVFANFSELPPELRIMIWKLALGLYSPRFVRWGEDRYPAAAQACRESRALYEVELTYWKTQAGWRIKVHLRKHDMFYFEHEIPGLKTNCTDTWARRPVPVQMTPSTVIWPTTIGDFVDNPLPMTNTPSPLWMSNITFFAVPIHLAFVYFRGSSVQKSNGNWRKLPIICPHLEIMFLLSRTDPSRLATAKAPTQATGLGEMRCIKKKTLDNERKRNPEQHWANQIERGYQRNRQNGNNPRDILIQYAILK